MLYRVRDILPVIAPHLRGSGVDITCDSSATQETLEAYNRINEILMNRDDWPGTEATVRFPAHSGIIVLPERFETIKGVAIDRDPAPIFPVGWKYLDAGPGDCQEARGLHCLGSLFPTARDLPSPLGIFAISDAEEAVKASLLITAYDVQNKEVRLSVPIAKASPSRSPRLTKPLKSIISIAKPVTKGHVDVGAWSTESGPYWLARIEPYNQSPNFTRYHLPGLSSECHSIVASVSLKHRDLYDLDDISLIQHREAYRLAAQAITAFDDNNGGLGSEFMNRAIKMLTDRVTKLQRGERKALNVSVSRNLTTKRHNQRALR